MERIFPKLYRFTHEPYPGVTKECYHYFYLLLRKQGNLFIGHCQYGSNVEKFFDEIDELGGISDQFVAHYFDAHKKVNDALYVHFGCKLHYHEEARKILRSKTKCPEIEFGDDGVRLGQDFRVFPFPGSRPGRTILWWQSGGKGFLFTGHSIRSSEQEWQVDYSPYAKPHLRPQIDELSKLRIDYTMPTRSSDGYEQFHELTKETKRSFAETIAIRTMTRAEFVRATEEDRNVVRGERCAVNKNRVTQKAVEAEARLIRDCWKAVWVQTNHR